jgi:hypothetical protein
VVSPRATKMSKRIAALLSSSEKALSDIIGRLEAKNGYPSHDNRHLAETIQKTRAKIADLGLDPDDTTAQELYQALLARFENDSRDFDKAFCFDGQSFDEKAETAIRIIKNIADLPQRWVLKNTAAKTILKQHPPKKLMRQTGYRSVESMVKRESLARIFISAHLVESAAWQKDLSRIISQKDSTAFEMRHISLIHLGDPIATDQTPALQYNDEVGTLGLVQNGLTEQMPLLSLTILLLDSLGSARRASQLSPVLGWWSDMDSLMAELDGFSLSLNISDVSLNHAHGHDLASCSTDSGRAFFWRSLLARYQNQLEIEEDTLADLSQRLVAIKGPLRQPAFEYAEDF